MKNLLFFPMLFLTFSICQGQWTTSTMPEQRASMTGFGSPTWNDYFWFAGGYDNLGISNKVRLYNSSSKEWEDFGELSQPRAFAAGIGLDFSFMVAGGINFDNGQSTTRVDIWSYNTQPEWTITELSVPRFSISAEALYGKVLFAGGANAMTGLSYDVVDIYDPYTQTWSTATLSAPRAAMGSAVIGNLAFFAGGFDLQTLTVSDRVDIYDALADTWSLTYLSEPRGFVSAVSVGDRILIAGGMRNDNTPSDRVDIYDTETGTWATATLSVPRAFVEAAGTVCDSAVFAGGGNLDLNTQVWIGSLDAVDIYDAQTGIWKADHLTHGAVNHAVVSNGDHLLVAGGYDFQAGGATDKVDILDCTITAVKETVMQKAFFDIYPNPGSGILYFSNLKTDVTDKFILKVYDMQGQVKYTDIIESGDSELNLNLPAGTYVLKVIGKTGIQSEVIIIQ